MLQRLYLGNASSEDIEFYFHELKESTIFNQTNDLSLAHQTALE